MCTIYNLFVYDSVCSNQKANSNVILSTKAWPVCARVWEMLLEENGQNDLFNENQDYLNWCSSVIHVLH